MQVKCILLFWMDFVVIVDHSKGKRWQLLQYLNYAERKASFRAREWTYKKNSDEPNIPGNEGGQSIIEVEWEHPLLCTSGLFDHWPHCQVPPAVSFIISLSKCLSLAKYTEALLWTSRCHSGFLGSTGDCKRSYMEKKTWFSWSSPAVYFVKLPEPHAGGDSLSAFTVFIYTTELDVIHQIVESTMRNYLMGKPGYLYQLLHSSASAHSLSGTEQ